MERKEEGKGRGGGGSGQRRGVGSGKGETKGRNCVVRREMENVKKERAGK
jgi:hypothetical protein